MSTEQAIIAIKTKCKECKGDMEVHIPDHLVCTKCGAECWDLINGVYNELPPLNEKFNYVIARPWYEGKPQLCTYAYGHEVFFGNITDARAMRDFINRRSEEKDYQIYTINPKPE